MPEKPLSSEYDNPQYDLAIPYTEEEKAQARRELGYDEPRQTDVTDGVLGEIEMDPEAAAAQRVLGESPMAALGPQYEMAMPYGEEEAAAARRQLGIDPPLESQIAAVDMEEPMIPPEQPSVVAQTATLDPWAQQAQQPQMAVPPPPPSQLPPPMPGVTPEQMQAFAMAQPGPQVPPPPVPTPGMVDGQPIMAMGGLPAGAQMQAPGQQQWIPQEGARLEFDTSNLTGEAAPQQQAPAPVQPPQPPPTPEQAVDELSVTLGTGDPEQNRNTAMQMGKVAGDAYAYELNEVARTIAEKGDIGEQELREMQEANVNDQVAFKKGMEEGAAKVAETMQKHDDLIQEIKEQKVDPGRRWSSMKGWQKVLATISVAAGGVAQGFGARENPGMAMLVRAVNADIDSQKENITNLHKVGVKSESALGKVMESVENEQAQKSMAFSMGMKMAGQRLREMAQGIQNESIRAGVIDLASDVEFRGLESLQKGASQVLQSYMEKMRIQIKMRAAERRSKQSEALNPEGATARMVLKSQAEAGVANPTLPRTVDDAGELMARAQAAKASGRSLTDEDNKRMDYVRDKRLDLGLPQAQTAGRTLKGLIDKYDGTGGIPGLGAFDKRSGILAHPIDDKLRAEAIRIQQSYDMLFFSWVKAMTGAQRSEKEMQLYKKTAFGHMQTEQQATGFMRRMLDDLDAIDSAVFGGMPDYIPELYFKSLDGKRGIMKKLRAKESGEAMMSAGGIPRSEQATESTFGAGA